MNLNDASICVSDSEEEKVNEKSGIAGYFGYGIKILLPILERMTAVAVAMLPIVEGTTKKRLTKFLRFGGTMHAIMSSLIALFSLIDMFRSNADLAPTPMSTLVLKTREALGVKKHEDSYRVWRVNYTDLVSKDIFLSFVLNTYEIVSIISSDEKPLTPEDLLDRISNYGIIPDCSIIFKRHKDSPPLSIIILRAGGDVSFGHNNNVAGRLIEDIVREIQGDILQSLNNKICYVRNAYYDSYTVGLKARDMAIPKYVDTKEVDGLYSLCKRSLEENEPISVLLYGEPGVGKTSIIEALLQRLDALVIAIDGSIPPGLVPLLNTISVPKILLIEELDTGSNVGMETSKTVPVSDLLRLLDAECHNLVLATSNSSKLNPALIRSGRIDIKRKVNRPDPDTINSIVSSLASSYNFSAPSDELINLCIDNNLTHADLHALYKLSYLGKTTPLQYWPKFIKNMEEFDKF